MCPKGAGPFPGILVVHGGAWAMGTREQLAGAALFLAEHGYTAVSIDYRLAPQDKFPAQIYDCAGRRALDARARQRIQDRSQYASAASAIQPAAIWWRCLGVLKDDELREPGVPADAPSARLQVVLAGGAPCDFRSYRPTAIASPIGSAAPRPTSRTPTAMRRPPLCHRRRPADVLLPRRQRRAGADPQPAKNGRAAARSAASTAEFYTVKGRRPHPGRDRSKRARTGTGVCRPCSERRAAENGIANAGAG